MKNKSLFQHKKSRLVAGVVVALVACISIGGTMAWLSARSETITNTFTYGDIDISLRETDTNDGDNNPNTNQYEMIPGGSITKDPIVTVDAGSIDSWLFVKLEKSANYDDFMTYEIADGWTALAGHEGVYYRETSKSENAQTFAVLKDNTVSVKETVTKDMLNALDANPSSANYPTLTIVSYAVQKAGIDTIDAAWAVTPQ